MVDYNKDPAELPLFVLAFVTQHGQSGSRIVGEHRWYWMWYDRNTHVYVSVSVASGYSVGPLARHCYTREQIEKETLRRQMLEET